ncbi:uncharacterized protein LOC143451761 [Clavelina lepadiformis]|uniref:uncharacterized protein LOC143451761 n=1 Tax=Clavelina lepadiformis TaxID=159417 RepID=UPI00404259CA
MPQPASNLDKRTSRPSGIYTSGLDLSNLGQITNLRHRILPPSPPSLPAFYQSSLEEGFVVPYRHEFGIAADASASFLLAFFTLTSSFMKDAKEKVASKKPNVAQTNNAEETSSVLFSCDFENGWCSGWNQSTSDQVDWKINQGPTRTKRTGPSADHTRLSQDGHYAYLEASGLSFGNKAIFRTPYVLMSDQPHYCLRFWYHMLGSGMGSLKVYWSPSKKAANLPGMVFLVLSLTGPQSINGLDWKEKAVTLQSPTSFNYREAVYFEFHATRGFLSQSDVAIDDISLSQGNCERTSLPAAATTVAPKAVSSLTTSLQSTTTTNQHKTNITDGKYNCEGIPYDPQSHKCCKGKLRRGNKNLECCGTILLKPGKQLCCGETPIWARVQGCCGGEKAYISLFNGCCGGEIYSSRLYSCTEGTLILKE